MTSSSSFKKGKTETAFISKLNLKKEVCFSCRPKMEAGCVRRPGAAGVQPQEKGGGGT